MEFRSALRTLAERRGYTMPSLCKAAGMSQHGLPEGAPTLSTAIRVLTPLGYQVAIVPSGSSLRDDCVKVDEYREPLNRESGSVTIDLDDPDVMIG